MSDSRGPSINIITWLCTGLAFVTVCSRLLSRLYLRPSAGWDDLAIGIAMGINVTYAIVMTHAVQVGMGRHLSEFGGPESIHGRDTIKWNVISTALSIFTFAVPKIGIALLLGRILGFMGASMRRQMLLYLPAILLNLWALATFTFWLRQCVHVYLIWEKPTPDDSLCTDHEIVENAWLAYSAFSAFLDFAYAIFPMLFVFRLQMSLKKKLNISGMLGLGVIAGIAAVYKCAQLPVLAHPHTDVTYTTAPLLYCIAIEANAIVIAASIPTLGPIVRLIRACFSRRHNEDGTPKKPQSFSSFGTPPFLRKALSHGTVTRFKRFSAEGAADDEQRLKKQQAALGTSSLGSGRTGHLASSAKPSPGIQKLNGNTANRRDVEAGLVPPPAVHRTGNYRFPPSMTPQDAEMELKVLGNDQPRTLSETSNQRYGHHEGHLGGGRVIMQ